jgi:hypothetical protein
VPTDDRRALARGQCGFVCGRRLKRPWTRRTLAIPVGGIAFETFGVSLARLGEHMHKNTHVMRWNRETHG